jgi:hypothetical protein
MNHSSGAMLDDEEEKDRPEEQVIGLHKIARPDLLGVIGQKRRSGLTFLPRRKTPSGLAHVPLNGPFAHTNPQFV